MKKGFTEYILAIFLALSLLFPFENTQAQITSTFQASPVEHTNVIDTVAGKIYWVHTVSSGHTLYSICKKYAVDAKDVIKDSPGTEVKIGEFVYIPGADNTPTSAPGLRFFSGKRPDTISRLSGYARNISNTSPSKDAYALDMGSPVESNDRISRREERKRKRESRLIPDTIIPQNETSDIKQNGVPASEDSTTGLASSRERNHFHIKRKKSKLILDISLLLPLYSNEQESRKAYVYLPFLEGSSLAWMEYRNPDFFESEGDSLLQMNREDSTSSSAIFPKGNTVHFNMPPVQSHSGWKPAEINLHVYDLTENSFSLQEICSDPKFLASDAVVAAAFVSQFEYINQICLKNDIPLIHPLSERDSMAIQNPYFIQLNASHSKQIQAIARMLGSRHHNHRILILSDSSKEQYRYAMSLKKLLPDCEFRYLNKETEKYLSFISTKDSIHTTLVPFYGHEISAVKTVLPLRQSKGNISIVAPSVWLDYITVDLNYFLKNNLCVYSPFFREENDPDFKEFSRKYYLIYKGLPNMMAYQGYLTLQWLISMMEIHNTDFTRHAADIPDNQPPIFNLESRENIPGFESSEVRFYDLKADGLHEFIPF